MKNVIFLLWLLFLLAFVSCGRKDNNNSLLSELVQAESLMYNHPDSALLILERMPALSSDDHLNHATWCLLATQAWDKNYKKHTSDSLINIAYAYFKKQDDPQRKALAANYEGAVNFVFGNTKKALQYFLEAAG